MLALTRRQPGLLALVAAGVLTADMLALALKLTFGRDRPYVVHPDPEPLLRAPLDLSFPSGHASTAFAGATILAAYAPRLGPWLVALAALVAWSRVYVGVHYPFDILVGALLGTAVGLAFVRAVRWRRARLARG